MLSKQLADTPPAIKFKESLWLHIRQVGRRPLSAQSGLSRESKARMCTQRLFTASFEGSPETSLACKAREAYS